MSFTFNKTGFQTFQESLKTRSAWRQAYAAMLSCRRFLRQLKLYTNVTTRVFGKEESVKETREGCLSRSIKRVFKLFRKLENPLSMAASLCRHAELPQISAAAHFFLEKSEETE